MTVSGTDHLRKLNTAAEYNIKTTEYCATGQISSEEDCRTAAVSLQHVPYLFYNITTGPKGCFESKTLDGALKLNYNAGKATTWCSEDEMCICQGAATTTEAPTTTTTTVAPTVYHMKDISTCTTSISTKEDCQTAATWGGLSDKTASEVSTGSSPTGCYVYSDSTQTVLIYNSAETNVECTGQKRCLCQGAATTTEAPTTTVAPTVYHMKDISTCTTSISTKEDCQTAATWGGLSDKTASEVSTGSSPTGCYVYSDSTQTVLIYNSAETNVECTGQKRCLCQGAATTTVAPTTTTTTTEASTTTTTTTEAPTTTVAPTSTDGSSVVLLLEDGMNLTVPIISFVVVTALLYCLYRRKSRRKGVPLLPEQKSASMREYTKIKF